MARFIFIGLLFGFFSTQSFSVDFSLSNIISSRAGGKSVDLSEGKDLKPFLSPGLCPKFYPWGAPKVGDKEVEKRSLYLCYTMFAVQYDPLTKTPLWSSEVLLKRNFEGSYYKHDALRFSEDSKLPSKMQIKPNDFSSKKYDLVQIASSINMIYNEEDIEEEKWINVNKAGIEESYYFTNVIPMVPSLRRGLWNDLEYMTRGLLADRNEIYVTTGPLYLGGNVKEFLGDSKIAVPTHFFKIITYPLKYGTVAYIIPNKDIATAKHVPKGDDAFYCGGSVCSLDNFVVSVKELEKLTGIIFYPKLAPHYAVQVKFDIQEILKRNKKKKDSNF